MVQAAAALILLLLGLLPIANWIPGGHDAPWYHDRLDGWLSGGAIALGVGIIAAIAIRRVQLRWAGTGYGARPDLIWDAIAARWRDAGARADAVVAIAVTGICAFIARTVLSARPLLIDEIIQLYQAGIFASGHLVAKAAPHPEFFSSMHLIDWGGKVYGQFPAGGAAMLAIGVLLHAAWLVGPVAAGAGVFLFARLVRRIEWRNRTALAALLLFAFAPFCLFLGGSMMNHVTETAWLLGAALSLAIATADEDAHPRAALWCGLALGMATSIRPVDGAVFAIPTAIWLLSRARRGGRHVTALLLSGAGVAIPVLVLLYVNTQQTGHALRFGYIEMWGKSHELGFHESPWGPAHTPMRGLELVNLYLLRLQTYFFETPAPSLLFATFALAFVPRLSSFDKWMLACGGGLLLAYFAYWHDGFYLGPRFMLPLAPWIALWTARLPAVLDARGAPRGLVNGVVAAGITALLVGAMSLVPLRAEQYRNGMLTMRFDVDAIAREHGVTHGLVLVRESWGAQLVARMWGVGVPRVDAEHMYRSFDACRLEQALTETEVEGDSVRGLVRRLAPYAPDSARLRTLAGLPDTTVRFLPGSTITARCVNRLREDQAGFTLYPPLLNVRGNDDVYVRDLHARDSIILPSYRGRPIWLLTKDTVIGGQLHFAPVNIDSMWREWRAN